jgi:hypothetical protein
MSKSINTMTEMTHSTHKLSHKWVYWAHLPQDPDWSIKSYSKICTLNSVEDTVTIVNAIPEALIKNGMLFIMKDGVTPRWEDPLNTNGGCFSYKISNIEVVSVWNNLCYSLVGETLLSSNNNITGITISPKKNFCIMKIWMSNCSNQNPDKINYFSGIDARGCLFKKHI